MVGGKRNNRGEGDLTSEDSTDEEVKCCCPTGCVVGERISCDDPEDAIHMQCSNVGCNDGVWMHQVCYEGWEQQLLGLLKASPRARSWSEKQRLQNLWTKRGYDITYKACQCPCSHGHLKKDVEYTPLAKGQHDNYPASGTSSKSRPRRRTNSKQMGGIGDRANSISGGTCGSHNVTSLSGPPRFRGRTLSLGSAAGIQHGPKHRFGGSNADFFHDEQVQISGSIFLRRIDMQVFNEVLPKWKVNGFHIKLEDDCPQGNDDTRIFLLTTLGDHQLRQVTCIMCSRKMNVYDKYPLVDGLFFTSPVNRRKMGINVRFEGKHCYLHAACVQCLESADQMSCLRCGGHSWFIGDRLILGGLYNFDILSVGPCCPPECKSCGTTLPPPSLSTFSAYSESSVCGNCFCKDYHHIRPSEQMRLGPSPRILNVQKREEAVNSQSTLLSLKA